jgi:hypothetical protein
MVQESVRFHSILQGSSLFAHLGATDLADTVLGGRSGSSKPAKVSPPKQEFCSMLHSFKVQRVENMADPLKKKWRKYSPIKNPIFVTLFQGALLRVKSRWDLFQMCDTDVSGDDRVQCLLQVWDRLFWGKVKVSDLTEGMNT